MQFLPIPALTDSDLARFWAKVKRPESGCWEWTASTDERGYGRFGIRVPVYKAHRVSWTIHHGQIPDGLEACHTCDNPSCVRPDHLFLGTQADNLEDCARKGRNGAHSHPEKRPRGESHGCSKLNASIVAMIHELSGKGMPSTRIVKLLPVAVHHSTVRRVIHGERWSHVRRVSDDEELQVEIVDGAEPESGMNGLFGSETVGPYGKA